MLCCLSLPGPGYQGGKDERFLQGTKPGEQTVDDKPAPIFGFSRASYILVRDPIKPDKPSTKCSASGYVDLTITGAVGNKRKEDDVGLGGGNLSQSLSWWRGSQ